MRTLPELAIGVAFVLAGGGVPMAYDAVRPAVRPDQSSGLPEWARGSRAGPVSTVSGLNPYGALSNDPANSIMTLRGIYLIAATVGACSGTLTSLVVIE